MAVHHNLSPVQPQRYVMPTINNNRPCYKVMAEKGWLDPDDILRPMGTIVYFDGTPPITMEPLNDKAVDIMTKIIEEHEKLGREAAKAAGKAYTGLDGARDIAQTLQERRARTIEMLGQTETKEILGKKRGRKPKVQTIEIQSGAAQPIVDAGSGKAAANRSQGL